MKIKCPSPINVYDFEWLTLKSNFKNSILSKKGKKLLICDNTWHLHILWAEKSFSVGFSFVQTLSLRRRKQTEKKKKKPTHSQPSALFLMKRINRVELGQI